MDTITARQQEILTFIQQTVEQKGYPPSLREIAGHFGMVGTRGAFKHVAALIRKGHLRKGPGARALEVISQSQTARAVQSKGAGRAIPILGRVAAGQPILAEENLLGHLTVDPSLIRGREAFLLKVNGESMREAGILDGDLVLVKRQADADSGEIVVAMLEGEATVKRLIKKKGSCILQPENADFDPIVITEKDTSFQILGKVVSLIRPAL